MTSPQAAALDIPPALATSPPTDDSPSASNPIDLTAEAQAEAAIPSPQREQPEEPIPLQESPHIIENNGNGVEAQEQQQGAMASSAGEAAIPGGIGLDNPVDIASYNPNYSYPQEVIGGLSDETHQMDFKRDLFSGMPMGSVEMQNIAESMLAQASQQQYGDPEQHVVQESQVQAFAKLQFEDGAFFMNTYSLGIGRDQVAAKKALRHEKAREARAGRSTQGNSHHHEPALSTSGGIVVHEDDDPAERRSRKRSKKTGASKNSQSRSSNSSKHKSKRSSSPNYKAGEYPYQSTRSGPDTEAARIDPASLRPSPHDCPIIGIHPKDGDCFKAYKGISRKHVTIAYNSTKCLFELLVHGRNGCFIQNGDDWTLLSQGTVHPLRGGDNLQISGIHFTFLLPINAVDDNGSELNAELDGSSGLIDTYYKEEDGDDNYYPLFRDARGKEMSTDHSQEIRATSDTMSSDEESQYGSQVPFSGQRSGQQKTNRYKQRDEDDEEDDGFDDEDEEQVDDDEDEEEEEEDAQPQPLQQEIPRQSIEEDVSPRGKDKAAKLPAVPKRSGPGRPPKNGVMSKRAEKELLKKQAEEAAAAEAKKMDPDTSEVPKKAKVGRPRKHPPPNPEEANREKRKYTKRKPKEPQDGAVEGAGSGDGTSTKVKKERVFKPPRSPTPVFDKDLLTEEQKVKPSENYVVIIYNAMTASKHKEMGLPQIYNAIKRVYPYFACYVETKGWESSVRHNLSGNPDVFEKGAKDGKGHMWRLKPGASIEKEKKKKPPVEQQYSHGQPQVIHQAPQGMHQYNPAMGPPYGYGNYPPPHYPGHYMPPPHPQQNGFAPPPGNYGPPPYPMSTIPAAIVAPPTAPGSYSSPYGPKPTESSGPQPNDQPSTAPSGQAHAAEQTSAHHTTPPATAPQSQYPPQPQYQSHQGPYPPQTQAPPQYSAPVQQHYPPPHPPHQHPTPPVAQQPPQFQPPPLPQSQNQTTLPPPPQSQNQPPQPLETQSQPSQVSQTQSQPSPSPAQSQAQTPTPSQAQNQSPSALQATQNQPPPPITTVQQALQIQPSQPSTQTLRPEVQEKVDKLLTDFNTILKKQMFSSHEIIDAAIEALRRDGNSAVPDIKFDKDKARSVKLIIDTLRTHLSKIPDSGFTAPPPVPTAQRSFQPSASVNSGGSPAHRAAIPRPSLNGPSIARPPMHTGSRRTDSGSPATPSSIHRAASVSRGGMGSPAAATGPISAQSASANSPNGANAATAPPPVSDLVPKTQSPAVSTPVERPTDVDVTMTVEDNDKGPNVNGQQLAGQKRARDDSDDLADEGQENVKRTQLGA